MEEAEVKVMVADESHIKYIDTCLLYTSYNLINNQNNQQSNGFAVNEKERGISGVFSAWMRKV